ncbi:MAG: sulfite exporter TauE/SafE family protein [Actinomycetaceae bacterium]|nr:sulfite exporter TauE/SafE family protein [Actinomycetaceae bacterium]
MRYFRFHFSRSTLLLICVGALAGFMSGFFGVGGGLIIVPGLMYAGLSHKEAAATSLASIIPISIIGIATYSFNGNTHWDAALLMSAGVIGGTSIGSWLLVRLSEKFLRWFYFIFIGFIASIQFIFTPRRLDDFTLSFASAAGLIILGIGIGIIAVLLGVGGGGVMVPSLMFIFHTSDLAARGSSLIAMLPGGITGSISNARKKMIHHSMAVIVGISACVVIPVGAWCAHILSAEINTYLFGIYLFILLIRALISALRSDG